MAPKVGGKHFAYTDAGKKEAKAEAVRTGKPMVSKPMAGKPMAGKPMVKKMMRGGK